MASVWCLWGAVGFPWCDFGAPFGGLGVHLVACGVHLVPFELHAAPVGDPFGCPWGAIEALGALWGLLGLPKWASNSGPMAIISAACGQKLASWNSTGIPHNSADPGEVRLGRQLATPFPPAEG